MNAFLLAGFTDRPFAVGSTVCFVLLAFYFVLRAILWHKALDYDPTAEPWNYP